MLIAATPGDNAGLEFDLCRRNRRLPAAAGWVPSSKFVPPWGLCGLNLAGCVCRADWEHACVGLPKIRARFTLL